jgi:fumarate reductase flavoprotein subunit
MSAAHKNADVAIHAFDPAFEYEAHLPLLIIGGGACGLVAALSAKAAGVELAVLERDAFPRGSTFMSSGFVPASNTRFQREKGVEDSPAIQAEDIQHKNDAEADPQMVSVLTQQSGRVVEWLADVHDVPFELVEGFLYPGHRRLRMHATPRRTGEELMGSLLNACEREGVYILTETRVIELHVDHAQCVRGITLQRPDGSRESIGCDALILACNGFGANPKLIEQYIPTMRDALYFGHESNTGDAVQWGEALGASLRDMHAFQGHGSLAWPHQTLISWALMMQGGVQINVEGQRFSNEHGGYSEQAAKVIAQPQQRAFNIFDGRIHTMAMDFEDYRNAHEAGAVKTFDTLEAMAQGLNLPLPTLTATFAQMQALGETGDVDAYGRGFTSELALIAPYHAIQVTGALFHTQGGVEVDTEARVLRTDGSAFPNLLAAGGAARGVSGSNDKGYLSGNGLLSAVVLGAISGETAAQYLANLA